MEPKPGFDAAWAAVDIPRDGEEVSLDLRPLLEAVYLALSVKPPDLLLVKRSLEELLQFLAAEGRTNANCWAADLFFCMDSGWEFDWSDQGLPDDVQDILAYMGEALHDTVKDPEIAENFDCLPEQLLERVWKLLT